MHGTSCPRISKEIIDIAAKANVAYMSSWYEVDNTAAIEKFKKAGTQVFKISNEELKVLEGYSWEYLLEEAKK